MRILRRQLHDLFPPSGNPAERPVLRAPLKWNAIAVEVTN
jgi:hypothetical protein